MARKKRGLPSTPWSLINTLHDPADRGRQNALQQLAQRYREPAYLHIRARGFVREEAEDLVQAFFAHALERDLFGQADPARGRFRSLFLTSLDNFLANARRSQFAAKRWPVQGFEDVDPGTLADPDVPESAFDGAFTRQLINQVLLDLEQECEETGRRAHHTLFLRRIVEPALDGAEPVPLKDLAESLGLSAKQATNHLTTMKRAFRRLLAARVQEYALSEDDLEREIGTFCRHLGIKKTVRCAASASGRCID